MEAEEDNKNSVDFRKIVLEEHLEDELQKIEKNFNEKEERLEAKNF